MAPSNALFLVMHNHDNPCMLFHNCECAWESMSKDNYLTKQRLAWIDIAKGIGIILVVYGHVARGLLSSGIISGPRWEILDSVIYTFHMPIFFFLAGLFVIPTRCRHGGAGMVLNKTETLLYPYFIWSLAQGFIEVILSKYTNGDTTVSDVLSLAWSPRAQFWFLYVLFAFFLLSSIIYFRSDLIWRSLIFASSAVMYIKFSHSDIELLAKASQNISFFTLGALLVNLKIEFHRNSFIALALSFILFSFLQIKFHYSFGMRSGDYGVFAWFVAASGIALIVMTAAFLASKNLFWLELVGKYSMHIYLMHIILGSGARVFISRVLNVDNVALHLTAGVFSGIFGSMAAYILTKKYSWPLFKYRRA
jgi:fucose 4-O-acetylase-like acetyltransferase